MALNCVRMIVEKMRYREARPEFCGLLQLGKRGDRRNNIAAMRAWIQLEPMLDGDHHLPVRENDSTLLPMQISCCAFSISFSSDIMRSSQG
jgi:hypothetical protein